MEQITQIHQLKEGGRYLVGRAATTYIGAGLIFTSSLEEQGALDLAVFRPVGEHDYRDLIVLREPSFVLFQVTPA
jgi:hypothetical protein